MGWEQVWERSFRRQRWIERDGHFYPRGTPETTIALDVAVRRAASLAKLERLRGARARARTARSAAA